MEKYTARLEEQYLTLKAEGGPQNGPQVEVSA